MEKFGILSVWFMVAAAILIIPIDGLAMVKASFFIFLVSVIFLIIFLWGKN